MVTSGNLSDVMVSTLAWNARDVDSIPALSAIFLIFIPPYDGSSKAVQMGNMHAYQTPTDR